MKAPMQILKGKLLRIETRKTRKDSDYHSTLARICIEGDRVVARCVTCNYHRLTLPPKTIDFLLTMVATCRDGKDAVITIKDGVYENLTNEVDPGPRCTDLWS
jgi:hypothetical protein